MIDTGHGVELGPLASVLEDYRQTLFYWRNHPSIMKWTRQNDLLTWEAHCKWFASHQLDPSVKMYGVFSDGRLAGVCGLTSIDLANGRAEFSLYIAPDRQRDGLGKSALATLLDHAFQTLGLNCVWGETFDGNPAAKLFEKLGFQKEGTRRDFYFRGGRALDAHLYSMLAREWDSRLATEREVKDENHIAFVKPNRDAVLWEYNRKPWPETISEADRKTET